MKRIVLGLTFALLSVGCGDEPPRSTANNQCEAQFEKAQNLVKDNRGLSGDLFPAVTECRSLDEWTSAAEEFPEAIVGMDPMQFLSNLCTHPEVTSEGLCLEVEAQE